MDMEQLVDQMDYDDIDKAYKLLASRRGYLDRKKAMNFRIGDLVQFESSKGLGVITGKVDKINTKTISLTNCAYAKTGMKTGNYRVSVGLLSKI